MAPLKEEGETLVPRDPIKGSRIVTPIELGAGLGLLAFAAVVPIAALQWWGRPATFEEFTKMVFLGIYMFAVFTTFAIIFLRGLGRLDIPDKFMNWLGAATIGELVGLLAYALRQN